MTIQIPNECPFCRAKWLPRDCVPDSQQRHCSAAALVEAWRDMPADEMRLRCGEMTAQEIRTVRAVLNQILPANAEEMRADENHENY